MTLHAKTGASPTPWVFRESNYRGGPNWIEDANGEQVLEGVSFEDGLRIEYAMNTPAGSWTVALIFAWVAAVAGAFMAFVTFWEKLP